MKKMISFLIISIILISICVIRSSASESNETELLALFNDMGMRSEALVEGKYPEGVFEKYTTYEMRINEPKILAEETRDGKIYARKMNTENFLSFYNEVFIEEISTSLLPSKEALLARGGIFEYDGIFYQMGGFAGLLRDLYIGSDAESCAFYAYGHNETVPYDELSINGNEAIMKLTLWEPNVTDGIYLGLRKLGSYTVTFLKTSSGWKISGGSFTKLLGFTKSSTIVNPSTGDRLPTLLVLLTLCAATYIIIRKKVI